MSNSRDAYDMARQAEYESKSRYLEDPTPQNLADANQAEAIADMTFAEMMEDGKK